MKRRGIAFVLLILFLWLVVTQAAELRQLRITLAEGQWPWLLAAALSQVIYYVLFAGTYWAAFHTVGIPTRIRELLPLTLSALFVNVVVPAGGAGGGALFTENLAQRGHSPTRAATGVLLQLIADFSALTLLLIPGLIYLFVKHDLKIYEVVTALILLLFVGGLSGVLLVGIWRPGWLVRLFGWVQRSANWLFGRLRRSFTLADDWAQKSADEFNAAAGVAANHPLRLLGTIGVAFLAYLVDIGTLYFLFQAFNYPITIGPLVAGLAVGILFWVISITPQGVGMVEGVMALTFTSLGVPGAVATAVALTFRGLTFWLPMLLGFFVLQRSRLVGADWRTLTETWSVRIVAVLVALMGIVNVLSALTPALVARWTGLEHVLPLAVRHGSHLTAALAGFALLLLAGSLARRKRVAWLLTLVVLGISLANHLFRGPAYAKAALAGGLMVVLWLMRAHFHARSDRPSVQQGLRVLAGALLFTLAYGVSGFYLLDRHYSVNFGFVDALRQTLVMFAQFYDPGLEPITGFGRYFAGSIYVVGAVTLSYAALMLLRPVFLRDPTSAEERARAQGIVEAYGHTSLARPLLFPDKRYFFTAGGSVIGYALGGRTAVTLGDPIGPPEDTPPAIAAFSALCRHNDWLPVFYQTLPETLAAYRKAGFDAVCIGQEAIVNLTTFTLQGKAGKQLRPPVNKLTRTGYTFTLHEPPIPDDLLAELRAISDEWLTTMHGSEKRFSIGWFDDEYIRASRIGAVHAPEGWISAFANLNPEYQRSEVTIDLMRHRRDMTNGTMEFLFVSLFEWARGQGYQSFNLGLSSLSGVGEQASDPAVERALHFIYENVNQFYNFKGLHSFKEKFQPEWSPRYLIYPGAANLTTAFLAAMRVSASPVSSYAHLPKIAAIKSLFRH